MDTLKGKYYDKVWQLVDEQGVTHPDRLDIPRKCRKPTVFLVRNDLFHEAVPLKFWFDVHGVMSKCPQHKFLVFTKHSKEMQMFHYHNRMGTRDQITFLNNVWSGLPISSQPEADEQIPIFLQVPGKKVLVIDPMLGEIDFFMVPGDHCSVRFFSAVILVGGVKPLHPDWIRSARDQCAAANVDFFFGGWGEWAPDRPSFIKDSMRYGCFSDTMEFVDSDNFNRKFGGYPVGGVTSWAYKTGRKASGRLLDGQEHNSLPWRTE